ncbi:hypothetical protein HUT16_15000 [Kitasatospora sp. NA04385]|uniref:hypothetical protein n=1 Tax=Kitasatospora sp. NA04385 TaxID=2742135 RepID=UPI001590B7F0|nr:hypothetical protein [Kitasatospora sp. NA04385]QKW20202.1 hypothetical protein HUT16_15000 [Kitasatospora sp. NA04385]
MDQPIDQCLDTFWQGEFTLRPPPPDPPAPDLPDLAPDLAALLAPLYRHLTG